MDYSKIVEQTIDFFENLSLESLENIHQVYDEKAYFRDPFNEVEDIDTIKKIYKHMFSQVNQPQFLITERIVQADQVFLVWDFTFTMKHFDTKTFQTIQGTSHLKFSQKGKIVYHRDYWDAAQELYEKIPILRGLMRLLKYYARG